MCKLTKSFIHFSHFTNQRRYSIMDKKSFIFIFIMVASFILINQWYSSKKQDQVITSMQSETPVTTAPISEDSLPKVAVTDLPLTPIYKEASSTDKMGTGLLFDTGLLTIQPKDYVEEIAIKKGSKLIPMQLVFQSDEGFCFYSDNIDIPLNTAFLPQFKKVPVVLVALNGVPTIAQGIYENQGLTLKDFPVADSIVLLQTPKAFYPIGFYQTKSKKFSLLSEYDHLRDFLNFKTPEFQEIKAVQQFYVLENEYQQVVFSNFGGAISEINLPLYSSTNENSVVKPVQFDRIITKNFPYEASFPISKAYSLNDSGAQVLVEPKVGGYYPLLRRNLIEKDGKPHEMLSRFYALNLISNGKPLNKQPFKLKRFEKNLIEFEVVEANRKITKTYSLPKDSKASPYCIVLNMRIEGDRDGVFLATGIPEVELIGNTFTPTLQFATQKNDKFLVDKIKLPKTSAFENQPKTSWLSNSNGYFGLILNPLQGQLSGYASGQIPGDLAPTRLSLIDQQYNLFPAAKYPGYELMVPIDPEQKFTNIVLYAGPFEEDLLKAADTGITAAFKTNPGFINAQTFYGWFAFISEPFAKLLFMIMKVFYAVTHSWGLSIILLTVVLRAILYPLNAWSMKSTAKMQEVSPKVSQLQEKYKKDPQRAQMEIIKLYKENKVNPFSGCLPMLIQLPFLIGMFDLLKSTFQLRGDCFIPGWITNLSAPDAILTWAYPIPFIGNSLHLLPILVGGAMLLQQRLSAPKIDPKVMTDQQRQQQTMGTMMTIIFPIMFYHFASGLNIYWLFSTLLGIAQQYYTQQKTKKVKALKQV